MTDHYLCLDDVKSASDKRFSSKTINDSFESQQRLWILKARTQYNMVFSSSETSTFASSPPGAHKFTWILELSLVEMTSEQRNQPEARDVDLSKATRAYAG